MRRSYLFPSGALLLGLMLLAAVGHDAFAGGAEVKADPEAYALLKDAHDHRDTFAAGFSGLRADVTLNDNGKEFKGTLHVRSGGEIELVLPTAPAGVKSWADEEIGSAIDHRLPGDFAHGDGSNQITFTPDDHSPIGRQVALNDEMKSTYRVRDGKITEVTRTAGSTRFTITVLLNRIVDDGKYLPEQFIVTYFDDKSGAIQRVDAFSDGYVRVSGAWVPAERRVISAEHGVFTSRSFTLGNIMMLSGATSAKK